MNSLHIRGKKVGTADVYVYERNYHVATFTITIDSPVSPIKLGNYKSRIHQGEKLQIDILNGGGEYRRENENRELVGFSVRDDTQAEEAKSTKKAKTGHVNITGKNPGNANLSFKDKYGQTKRIGITVRNTELKLSYTKNEDNELHLKGTDFEYISISEAVIGIRSYTNENRDVASIFLTRIKDSSNPGKYITIFKAIPKSSGTTKFTAYDYEGNFQEIIVRVGKKKAVVKEKEEVSDETDNTEVDEELEEELRKLFEELGVNTNSVEIAAADNPDRNATACHLTDKDGNAKYYLRPYNATCNDGFYVKKNAWACQNGYTDLYNDGINSCIKTSVKSSLKSEPKKYIDYIYNKFGSKTDNIIKNAANITSIEKLELGQKKLYSSSKGSVTSRELVVIFLDDLKTKMYTNIPISEKVKIIKKGVSPGAYASKILYFTSQVKEIDEKVNARFAKNPSLFTHFSGQRKITYSKVNVTTLKSIGAITTEEYGVLIKYEDQLKDLYSEILKDKVLKDKQAGTVAGSDQALEDYIVESLLVLNPLEFIELAKGITNADLGQIKEDFEELVDIYKNREEIFAGLSDYKKAYYIGYLETTFAMVVIPAKLNKVNKFKGKGNSKVIAEIKAEKRKKDEGFKGSKYIPDVRAKIEGKIDHIVTVKIDVDIDGVSSFGGVHSRKAITHYNSEKGAGSAWFENVSNPSDTRNNAYNAVVKVKKDNGEIMTKTGNVGGSTMFPDSWDGSKIINEVEYAVKNNKGRLNPNKPGDLAYYGYSKSGIKIKFIYNHKSEEILTYYPLID